MEMFEKNVLMSKEHRDIFRTTILKVLDNPNHMINGERWFDHPLIDDREFSNLGNVRHRWNKQVLKQQVNSNGYMGVNVKINGKGRRFAFVHRLLMESAMAYVGIGNYFYEINHIDGNKKNNNLNNLEWVTREENLEHSRKNKLTYAVKGENHPNCKFKNTDIDDMRELRALGYSYTEIAKSYGTDRTRCSNLINKGRSDGY